MEVIRLDLAQCVDDGVTVEPNRHRSAEFAHDEPRQPLGQLASARGVKAQRNGNPEIPSELTVSALL